MAKLDNLRQELYRKKQSVGLVGSKININEYDEQEHNVVAFITPQGWNIEVNVRKGFNPVSDRRQRAYARKKKIEDGLETLISHVTLHEFAHWELPSGSERGCPYDLYNHDKILEAVKEGLPENKKAHISYVANAFEDTVINPRVREWNGDFSGQVLFWDNECISAEDKGQAGFTPFYEAFVKLNMHLWGDNADRALLKRHYTNEQTVNEGVEKVVRDLGLPEDIQDTTMLFDKRKWSEMARAYAKNLAHLLDESPTERLSAYSREGDGSEAHPEAGNGIEQKMGTREGKEDISHGRYLSGDKQSPNFTSFEQLDSLYRRLARAIPVEVEAMTREQELEISPLNYRAFDPEVDDPAIIKPSKLIIGEDGLTFGVPNQPLTVMARSKIQKKGFPDFKLIMLDDSGSMALAVDGSNNVGNKNFIPWGDKSRYHYALLGLYGAENFLQRQGIAQYINHGLALFSSQTRYKESGFTGIDEVRRHALNPDWGPTNVDASTLKRALQGRQSFVLSISDGEISNWSSEKGAIEQLVKNNYFAHIQIGGGTDFTRDLESWDKPVFYVTNEDDLTKLIVDTTRKTYRRFTRE